MGTPQIIYIVLIAVSFGVNLADEKVTAKSLLLSSIGTVITLALLIWGGFFS